MRSKEKATNTVYGLNRRFILNSRHTLLLSNGVFTFRRSVGKYSTKKLCEGNFELRLLLSPASAFVPVQMFRLKTQQTK